MHHRRVTRGLSNKLVNERIRGWQHAHRMGYPLNVMVTIRPSEEINSTTACELAASVRNKLGVFARHHGFPFVAAWRAAGVSIKIGGDDLVLEAATPPPAAVLDALSYHKPSILALLRSVTIRLSAEDWRALFEERTNAFQREGGLQRDLAEAKALAACVTTWLNRNPVISPAGRCIVCGRGDRRNDVVLPYGTTPPGAAWLHSTCWSTWWRERRDQAVAALTAIDSQSLTPSRSRNGALMT
jgi:hypothetical protein